MCKIAAIAFMPVACVVGAETAGMESPWKVLPMFGGGYVQNVIPCPSNPDRFYSYVDVGGPYRSDDRCRTWNIWGWTFGNM